MSTAVASSGRGMLCKSFNPYTATVAVPLTGGLAQTTLGVSPTDGATTNPTITGTLGTPGIAGVSIPVDFNGDGIPDSFVTTDANGHFTFTPAG